MQTHGTQVVAGDEIEVFVGNLIARVVHDFFKPFLFVGVAHYVPRSLRV